MTATNPERLKSLFEGKGAELHSSENTSERERLMPCPAGHDEARLCREKHDQTDSRSQYPINWAYVDCKHRHENGSICGWHMGGFPTAAEAIATWNTRADAETIRALKETRDHWIGLADVRYEQLAALTKQNAEILAELERVRKDAARWQWMRERPHQRRNMIGSMFELDLAVDSCIEEDAALAAPSAAGGEKEG